MSEKFLKARTHFIPFTVGLIFCWFGVLKFIPGMSPAEELAKTTLDRIFFGTVSDEVTILLLGVIECTIGLMLVFYDQLKYTLIAAMLHLSCTFLPLIMFPELTMGLTGQYILKNIIIMAALLASFPFKKKRPVLNTYHSESTDPFMIEK
jgi:hypothetical protein